MKIISIQTQLILNIVIPVIAGLLIIGGFSYRNTEAILQRQTELEQSFVYDEIKSFIELQFVALSIIEEPMETQMRNYSNQLVNEYFTTTKNIENEDLFSLRQHLGMDTANIDIYVINSNGVVVNTTFSDDMNINFFNFGESHKQYLLNIFREGKFDSPKFFFEHKTHRYKKYSYQPTIDRRYIVEIGLYSRQADRIFDYLIEHLEKIPQNNPNLNATDLFFMASGKPYALNLESHFIAEHLSAITKLLGKSTINIPSDTTGNSLISYTYFYVPDSTTKIFDGTIIRLTKDASSQLNFIKKEKIKISITITVSLILIFFLLLFRSKKIAKPIKRLIDKTKIIAHGDYSERVIVEGNNEISLLSEHFNTMVNNIEQRVSERTQILENQTAKLKSFNEDHEKQNQLNRGLILISDVMRKNKGDLNKLSDQLLSTIVKHVDALRGALYLHEKINNEDKLKLLAHYGLSKDSLIDVIEVYEGLTGQCYSEGKVNFVEDLPEKYFSISSGLGSSTPKALALIPMKIEDSTIGVIEIASFKMLEKVSREFLLKAADSIASQLNIVKMNNESQLLINNLKKFEKETNAKNQEIMENMEELKAVQEESNKKEFELQQQLNDSRKQEQKAQEQLDKLQK